MDSDGEGMQGACPGPPQCTAAHGGEERSQAAPKGPFLGLLLSIVPAPRPEPAVPGPCTPLLCWQPEKCPALGRSWAGTSLRIPG